MSTDSTRERSFAFPAAKCETARASGEPGRFWLWAAGPGDCYPGAVAVPLMKVCALFQSS
jgi:hypothetical protein